MAAIEVEKLTKYYRQHFWTPRRKVLDAVSFNVERGEIFGFLGPNGSGKSTTIKILLEIIYPSSGTARLFGKEIGSVESKMKLGFLPENPYFYDFLTATQFLEFHGGLYGLSKAYLKTRIPQVLELVGMKGTEKYRLRSFSKGMLQRIGLAQSIIHDPELVILDEPMTGLDPVGRKEVRDLMIQLKSEGKTVFFSTHILSDVESICDRVAILNRGKLLACGRLEELVSVESQYIDIMWSKSPEPASDWLGRFEGEVMKRGAALYCKVLPHPEESMEEFELRVQSLIRSGMEMGGRLQSLTRKQESLEEIFVRQVGNLESRV